MSEVAGFFCQKQNCAASCCGAFDGVSDRIVPVGGRKFKEIVLTSSDLERIRGSRYEDFIYIAEDGLGRVKTADDGVCLAYESGQCLINEMKPTICQCFPLYLDVFIGLCAIKDCPSVTDGLTIKSYAKEIEHFLEMCEFWISHYRQELDKLRDEGGAK